MTLKPTTSAKVFNLNCWHCTLAKVVPSDTIVLKILPERGDRMQLYTESKGNNGTESVIWGGNGKQGRRGNTGRDN